MRKTIIAGNWKMNANKSSVKSLIGGILSGMDGVNSEVLVCVPFPYLSQVESLIDDSNLKTWRSEPQYKLIRRIHW